MGKQTGQSCAGRPTMDSLGSVACFVVGGHGQFGPDSHGDASESGRDQGAGVDVLAMKDVAFFLVKQAIGPRYAFGVEIAGCSRVQNDFTSDIGEGLDQCVVGGHGGEDHDVVPTPLGASLDGVKDAHPFGIGELRAPGPVLDDGRFRCQSLLMNILNQGLGRSWQLFFVSGAKRFGQPAEDRFLDFFGKNPLPIDDPKNDPA